MFEVVCATEPCSGLVVFHKDCLRTVKLRTCVHQGGVVFEMVGATEPCSGRVIRTVKLRTCVHQGGVVFEIVGATEPCSGRVIANSQMEDLCPSRAVVRPVLNLMLELIARNNSNTKVVIGLCPPSDSLV